MKFFYAIFIDLMVFGFKLGSLFNDKLKKGIEGRKQSLELVRRSFKKKDRVIWMHAASLGEYEQGVPILEKLKENFPKHKILITFFSPSGYEQVIKKNHLADVVCYLPFDRKKELQNFTRSFRTEIFITVKYEYWYQLMEELRHQKTKIYVVAALFYEQQVFFKNYGKAFVQALKRNVDWFFHQNENSKKRAENIGLINASVSGDTRFDRVKQIRNRDNQVEIIENFKQNQTLVVFGSSWEAEEEIAKSIVQNPLTFKIIIAPHDLKRVSLITSKFPEAVLYSSFSEASISSNILIIDNIGLLTKIYSYADIAFVGGGFHGKGLHNILEPATFGIPVLFGNQYRKNPEADALIERKGGKSFEKADEAGIFLNELIQNPSLRTTMGKQAEDFVRMQPNATEHIFKKIWEDYSSRNKR